MSFFITAGSGYKSGSSYNQSGGNNLNQMTSAVQQTQNSRFRGHTAANQAPPQPSSFQGFRVNPSDYRPRRIGIRYAYKAIVVDYELKSTGKRCLHNIKVGKYTTDPMAFGISVSRSGSFAEALQNEISRIVDRIYAEHCEYLPPEKVDRSQVEELVNSILVFQQTKKKEQMKNWNEIQNPSRRESLSRPSPANSKDPRATNKSSNLSPDVKTSDSFKQRQQTADTFFGKRSTSGLSQGKGSFQEAPIVQATVEQLDGSINSNSGKKGKKKKKKGSKSQVKTSAFPDPTKPMQKNPIAVSHSKVSSSGNNWTGSYSANDFEESEGIAGSKSMASLNDLPIPAKTVSKAQAAVQGFQDFDDWDLDNVEEEKPAETSMGNKFSNHSTSPPIMEEKTKWSPPKPQGKLEKKNAFPDPGAPFGAAKGAQSAFPDFNQNKNKDPFAWDMPDTFDKGGKSNDSFNPMGPTNTAGGATNPLNSVKTQAAKPAPPQPPQIPEEPEIAVIDTRNFDYNTTDLNKLTDAEIRAHKKGMDEHYNKNFVGKKDPGFQYDKRIDFKAMRETAKIDSEDSWD